MFVSEEQSAEDVASLLTNKWTKYVGLPEEMPLDTSVFKMRRIVWKITKCLLEISTRKSETLEHPDAIILV